MKKNVKSIITLICVGFALMSCSKTDTTPAAAPTELVVHCIDGSGNIVTGASVLLYNNQTDWQNNTNTAFSGTSDNNGNATFSGVNSQIYYFACVTQSPTCLYNWAANSLANPIAANTTSTVNAVMTGYGKLTVTSTSSNPYEIKLNGNVWVASLAGGASISTPLPLGACTVEAIQLSGYAFTPTDNTYAPTITQCNTTIQDIP